MRASTDGRVSGPESSTGHEFINSAIGLIATVVLVSVVVQDSRKHAGLVDLHVKTEELFKEITQLGSVAQELAMHGHERAAQQVAAHRSQIGRLLVEYPKLSAFAASENFKAMRAAHERMGILLTYASDVRVPASAQDDLRER
jgi:hypothetical protein